ncbi:hypothetical protein N7499_004224 [Penicillium canescens]|uniref:DNA/RNA-binding domain-containing protein n=1 Tax=Penicillium canescens TaxID=5083 RepID=A0AAD6I9H9_PENCN|nr:uncharacterized protein N7446_005093 [Penicillium canescens]KAJ6038279.1 hypothetical protein N7460_008050 [Penicillium canescens]KAJ6068056.1 hypothetical protein N7446_005093 [Penicillium canescens]KAJ6088042.1 hypothetical protein N7499_004224 [Penicillium canescens]
MVTLLLEQVPNFKGTWFECLGDLARYRMAVKDTDVTVRDVWAEVSRYWYNQYLDQRSEPGRIQHHLAVLSRSDTLQRFFYYSKALLSVDPFANARESMIQLFNPILSAPADRHTLTTSFVDAHGVLFLRMPSEQFDAQSKFLLVNLRQEVSWLAILQYGEENGAFAADFVHDPSTSTTDAYVNTKQWASTTAPIDLNRHCYTDFSSQFAFRASSLAFHTLIVILGQASEPSMHPALHDFWHSCGASHSIQQPCNDSSR